MTRATTPLSQAILVAWDAENKRRLDQGQGRLRVDEAAKTLGRSRVALSAIRNGSLLPSVELLDGLGGLLHVSPEELDRWFALRARQELER